MRITVFQKFHPNQKFRSWAQARGFGGTSKPKSLYICGFRRRNFFLLCATVATIAVIIAAGGGYALTRTLNEGKQYKEELQRSPVVTTRLTTNIVVTTGQDGATITTFQTSQIIETRARTTARPITSTAADGSVTTVTPEVDSSSSTSSGAPVPSSTGTDTTTGPAAPTTAQTTGQGTTATSSTPGPTSLSSSSSSSRGPSSTSAPPPSGDLRTGEATFYAPGLGSCGIENTDSDFICALSRILFDPDTPNGNSNANPNCGRKIFVRRVGGNAKRRRGDVTDEHSEKTFTTATIYNGRYARHARRVHRRNIFGQDQPHNGKFPHHLRMNSTPTTGTNNQPLITPPPKLDPAALEKRQLGGGGVTVTVVDRCPVCAENDLDLSPAAFSAVGEEAEGRVEIEWTWLD